MCVGTHVHGLLLAPHELSIGVAPQLPLYQIKGEGAQLQHTTLHVSLHLGCSEVGWGLGAVGWAGVQKQCDDANKGWVEVVSGLLPQCQR